MKQEPKVRGRKKKDDSEKKKGHPVYATDAEWGKIEQLAQDMGMEVSPFIVKKALQ